MAIESLLGGAFNMFGSAMNNAFSQQAAEDQYNRQIAFWEMQNQYNTPGNQVKRLEKAGLNPALMYGSGSGANTAGQLSDVPGNDYAKRGVVDPTAMMDSALKTAQIANINADTDKKRSETTGVDNTNSMFSIVRAAAQSNAISAGFRAKIEEISAEYARINAITDLAQKNAALAELDARVKKELSEVSKNYADESYTLAITDATVGNIKSGTALHEAQTKTEGFKQNSLAADAGLKNAQTKTEDQIRDDRVRLTNSQADAALASVGLAHAKTSSEYQSLVRWLIGEDRSTSLWSLIDKFSEKFSNTIGSNNSANREDLYRKLITELQGVQ